MELRAIIEMSENWWIGWLIDLPGINVQERSWEEVLDSPGIGA